MPDTECCATCRHAYALEECDYSGKGCVHTPLGGFVCMAFADERKACWMMELDATKAHCVAYEKETQQIAELIREKEPGVIKNADVHNDRIQRAGTGD